MPLLIVVGLLLVYGILALFSVSVHESFTTTLSLIAKGKLSGDPSNYYYFFKQLKNFIYVAVVSGLVYMIPLKFFKNQKALTILSIFIFGFQLLVFTPLGNSLGGAKGWLDLPFLPSIQPAEFFKIGYVIFIAWWFSRRQHLLNTTDILKKFFFMNIAVLAIFVAIPDLGSVLVMGLTGLVITLYAGVSIKNIARMIGIGSVIAAVFIGGLMTINTSFCQTTPGQNTQDLPGVCRYTYIAKRLDVFLDPDQDSSGRNVSRQNRQAIIAIGGGGFRGKGYGKGLQKFGYIPEAQSDFIFAAFAEEVGFIGIMALFVLYGAFVFHTMKKLPFVRDNYLKLIAVGLISLIIVQIFVHIGVNIQLLPNTGLTLPFISYGGTSLMTSMICVVLLYKILYVEPHKTI